MKFNIENSSFSKILKFASNLADNKSIRVSHHHTKLEIKEEYLFLSCGNESLAFVFRLKPHTVYKEGVVCVNSKKLSLLADSYQGKDCLEFEDKSKNLLFKANKSRNYLEMLHLDNFILLPEPDSFKQEIVISDVAKFAEAINTTAFCCSKIDQKFENFKLECANKKLTFYASDGQRIIKDTIDNDSEDFSLVIPGNLSKNLIDGLNLCSGSAKLKISDNKFVIKNDDFTTTGVLSSLGYPNVKMVFDFDKFDAIVSFKKEDIFRPLKRAVDLADDTLFHINFEVAEKELKIYIKADGTEVNDQIEIVNDENKSFKVGLNGKFLHAFLSKVASSDEIVMKKVQHRIYFHSKNLIYMMSEIVLSEKTS
jgi:DNA polymerase III sliding clamp (beta) subunit (PCNA family)